MVVKIKKNWEEWVFKIASILIVVSPAFIIKDEIGTKILYVFLSGWIGWGVGKEILHHYIRKDDRRPIKIKHYLLSNIAILIYILLYLIISILIDLEPLKNSFLVFFGKDILGTYVLYAALISMTTKKGFIFDDDYRGLSDKRVILNGIFGIIFALLLLTWRWIRYL